MNLCWFMLWSLFLATTFTGYASGQSKLNNLPKSMLNFMNRVFTDVQAGIKNLQKATVPPDSPASFLNNFKGNLVVPLDNIVKALTAEEILKHMLESNKGQSLEDVLQHLNGLNFTNSIFDSAFCDSSAFDNTFPADITPDEPVPQCITGTSKYRSIDGTCNNFLVPIWGRAFTKFRRFIPSKYDDGVNQPRTKSVTGKPLPCARAVSANVIKNAVLPNPSLAHLFMQWGQFLDHDITQTPSFTVMGTGEAPVCCKKGNDELGCFPIKLCKDPFYSSENQNCMEFVRSLPALNTGCSFGPREQMNRLTTYIDASNVYGSTTENANKLREMNSGLLKSLSVPSNSRPLLPNQGQSSPEQCISQLNAEHPDKKCDFVAGDTRVNIIPTLVGMHTIWMREHNRIAAVLKVNGITDVEMLFQETKRIIGAMMQHITYNEFLPIVFGSAFKNYPHLQLLNNGYYSDYSPLIDPSISNSFATAAFRFGHSLVNGMVNLYDSTFQKVEPFSNDLKNHFFRSYDIYDTDMLDRYVRGAMVENSQKTDNVVTEALTKFLFKMPNQNFGLDLVSLNVQRGRDHGLPPWIEFRKACKLSVPNTFDDLHKLNIISFENVELFKTVYRDINDIDLWPGGISEILIDGGAIGSTFACIFNDTFTRLRRADRFWYENIIPVDSGFKNQFTLEQLTEIRKSSLARVLCDNVDIKKVQRNAMRTDEVQVPCDQIPFVDLQKWPPTLAGNNNVNDQTTHPIPNNKAELLGIFTRLSTTPS